MIERFICYFKTRGERRATSAFVRHLVTYLSISDNGQSQSSQAVASPSNIESHCRPTVSKKAKLFSFMSSSASNTSSQSSTQLRIVEKQFASFSAKDIGGQGINVFNEKRFRALRPLISSYFVHSTS